MIVNGGPMLETTLRTEVGDPVGSSVDGGDGPFDASSVPPVVT